MKLWDYTIDLEFHGFTGKQIEKRIALFRDATNFFASSLFRKLPKISVDISLSTLKDVSGWCIPHEHSYYSIEISKKKCLYEQIITLAHEMVHCKQFYNGELHERNGVIFWKRVPYYDAQDENTPWEIEAYTKEQVLVENFINSDYNTVILEKELAIQNVT